MASKLLRACAVCVVIFLASCSTVRPLSVSSDPSGAMIKLDDHNVGVSPTTINLDLKSKKAFLITASKSGYFDEVRLLSEESEPLKSGVLRLIMKEDEAWRVTTTSEATNNWMRVQVDARIAESDVWQKLVDSVTTRYTSLEQLDNSSGYLRTIYQVRRFHGLKEEFRIRTRFLCSIASKKPLVYKFRIESEQSSPRGDWEPYSRVFKEDAAMIEELQNRLGVK